MKREPDSMEFYSMPSHTRMKVLQGGRRHPHIDALRTMILLFFVGIALGYFAGKAFSATPGSSVSWASWYGPGLYGNHLACGGTLTTGTYGVAHKTLPCGSRLVVCFHRRCTRVRVVDRGPFVAGREFDLTGAVATHLHFSGAQPIRWWRARHAWR
jgi:hypothetical protein